VEIDKIDATDSSFNEPPMDSKNRTHYQPQIAQISAEKN
jgi:hypothetical protein